MAFDFGWDFRGASGFVTDPTYAKYVNYADTYPKTYTNGDGLSINGGWVAPVDGSADQASGNDPRIAGYNYHPNDASGGESFRVDLSSGSAPGAGNYTVDIAVGAPSQALTQTAQVKDTTTVVADLTNGGAGHATASGHFIDANAADITATTTWTGTTKAVTFATTTVNVHIGLNNVGSATTLAHFRLTLATVAASLLPPPNRFAHMLVR